MDALNVFSLIASIVAVLVVVFGIAYWKGNIDQKIKQVSPLPELVMQLKMKMDVLWSLFVEQTLSRNPNLANHGSSYKLTDHGEKCLEDVKHIIEEVKREYPNLDASDVLTIIAQKIGMAELAELASKNGCSPSEYMAMLTVKLGVEI